MHKRYTTNQPLRQVQRGSCCPGSFDREPNCTCPGQLDILEVQLDALKWKAGLEDSLFGTKEPKWSSIVAWISMHPLQLRRRANQRQRAIRDATITCFDIDSDRCVILPGADNSNRKSVGVGDGTNDACRPEGFARSASADRRQPDPECGKGITRRRTPQLELQLTDRRGGRTHKLRLIWP